MFDYQPGPVCPFVQVEGPYTGRDLMRLAPFEKTSEQTRHLGSDAFSKPDAFFTAVSVSNGSRCGRCEDEHAIGTKGHPTPTSKDLPGHQ